MNKNVTATCFLATFHSKQLRISVMSLYSFSTHYKSHEFKKQFAQQYTVRCFLLYIANTNCDQQMTQSTNDQIVQGEEILLRQSELTIKGNL